MLIDIKKEARNFRVWLKANPQAHLGFPTYSNLSASNYNSIQPMYKWLTKHQNNLTIELFCFLCFMAERAFAHRSIKLFHNHALYADACSKAMDVFIETDMIVSPYAYFKFERPTAIKSKTKETYYCYYSTYWTPWRGWTPSKRSWRYLDEGGPFLTYEQTKKNFWSSFREITNSSQDTEPRPTKLARAVKFQMEQNNIADELAKLQSRLLALKSDVENGNLNKENINRLYLQFEEVQRTVSSVKRKNGTFVGQTAEETAQLVEAALTGTK